MVRLIALGASVAAMGCNEYSIGEQIPPGARQEIPEAPNCEAGGDVVVVPVSFEQRQGCPWGEGDNLERRNEHNQARVEEIRQIVLPAGAEVCDLEITSSEGAAVWFDDHILLALDDVVLVAGGSGLRWNEIDVVDGVPRYDWPGLRGRPFAERYAPYVCLGGDQSECRVPRTEEVGPLVLSFPHQVIADLVEGPSFQLTLVTFGDDDNDDCAHAEVELAVGVRFVQP